MVNYKTFLKHSFNGFVKDFAMKDGDINKLWIVTGCLAQAGAKWPFLVQNHSTKIPSEKGNANLFTEGGRDTGLRQEKG